MKSVLKISFLTVAVLYNTAIYSQTDSTANLVFKKVTEALVKGDCAKAQRNYNIWKDLTSKRNADIEAEIKECEAEKEKGTAQNKDYIELEAAKIAVQKVDITNTGISWNSADILCKNSIVGGFTNWRLPTLNELATIYSSKQIIGNFKGGDYWSSDAVKGHANVYHFIDFNSGSSYSAQMGYSKYCRCVRTLP